MKVRSYFGMKMEISAKNKVLLWNEHGNFCLTGLFSLKNNYMEGSGSATIK